MPTLFDTKYPNNSRVVSGTVTLYRDDVILLCDTSVAPVTINLFEIPDNYWSTQWKLYIIDNSNNASVNNITINAGSGQTINTASSLVLNTNGSTALVRIVSNADYIATLGAGGIGGGGYNTIKDEGVALPQRTTIDFIGKFVAASDNGTETQVTVNPTIEEVTNLQLTTLISTNSLIKGLTYKVTDTPYLLNVSLLAIDTNQVSSEGDGLLYVADYQNVGDYSGVAGFNSQLGLWYGALTPVSGDVVIWNNLHWVNLTGVNALTSPDLDLVNWSQLAKSSNTGYILEPVTCQYIPQLNVVSEIKDIRLNQIELSVFKFGNSFLYFPFGNANFISNQLKGKQNNVVSSLCNTPIAQFTNNVMIDSLIDFDIDFKVDLSSLSVILANNYLNVGQIQIITSDPSSSTDIIIVNNYCEGGNISISNIDHSFTGSINVLNNRVMDNASCAIGFDVGSIIIGNNSIFLQNNYINSRGRLYCKNIDTSVLDKSISNNTLTNASELYVSLANRADFIGNRVYKRQIIDLGTLLTNGYNGINCILSEEQSTFGVELDLSDPLVYDSLALTLNLNSKQWAGIFYLINGTGNNITKVINYSTEKRPVKLVASGGSYVLTYSPIIGVAPNEIVDNTNLNVKTTFAFYTQRPESATLILQFGAWFVKERENWT
jgi:hypothetical protein